MKTARGRRAALALAAAIAFLLFFALGAYVRAHGEPAPLLGVEAALFDRSALIAWWATWMCYVYVLAPIVVALLVIAWLAPQWRARILFSIGTLLLCWIAADAFQHLFARPRGVRWVVRHETAFSYPSSHATISTGFYVLWAVLIYRSSLRAPLRVGAAVALVALAATICWARVALGAHYLTDLAGGVLLATALACAGGALLPANVFGESAGRP